METLAAESAVWISFRLTWRDYRHISMAIDREVIRDSDAIFDDYNEDDEDQDPSKILLN
jgi:hypothetical protein